MRHVTESDPTNGILDFPQALQHFRLRRHAPAEDLRPWIEGYWVVAWDLPPGKAHRQANVSHASINVAVEPEGSFLYGVPQRTFVREIRGTGWVFGVKLRPGGFFHFWSGGSLGEPLGRRLPFGEIYSEPGAKWSQRMAVAQRRFTREVGISPKDRDFKTVAGVTPEVYRQRQRRT